MSRRTMLLKASAVTEAALRQQHAGKLELAAKLYEQALRFGGESAPLFCNLGEAYRKLGRHERAVTVLVRATALEPALAPAHYNLGLALDGLSRRDEAVGSYLAALELRPELPNLLAFTLEALREIAAYERALQTHRRFAPLAPDSVRLRIAIAAVLAERGQVDDSIDLLRAALRRDPTSCRAHGNLVYLLPFSSGTRPLDVVEEARRFDSAHAAHVPRSSHGEAPGSSRRLRVGYLSPDFREHPTALFMPELLRHHDREKVEVFCYSHVHRPDARTAQMRQLADTWRDVAGLTDEAAATAIHADGLDVLVDLAMHTGQSRPLLMARKPARVQACWLAYPGTTGLAAIDFRFTDPFLDPEGTDPAHYSERSVQLETFWCYSPPADDPAPSELPALQHGGVTFGCLNAFKKVSPEALELWARVLRAIPRSRLILLAPAGEASSRVLTSFERDGVDASRVLLVRHSSRQRYLETFHRIDCTLDTLPYGGGTSTLDAVWMGVPVLTLRGRTVAGRAGSSIAHQLGLPQLVADSPEHFVQNARALVADLSELARLREGLRARLRASPLMDPRKFARSMERALFTIARPC